MRPFPARPGRTIRYCWIIAFLCLAPAPLPAQLTTHLSPATEAAYNDYVKRAESAMDWRAHLNVSRSGSVEFQPGNDHGTSNAKGGLIHDWMAAGFAPGATMEKVLAVFQDYPAYQRIYAPNVQESTLLSRDGNHWRVFLKLYKKKILSVLLDSEWDIEYRALDGNRWAILAPSTKISELDDGRELPQGTGHGFLWRSNTYWTLEPRPGGVYLECRTISLSRDVPTGLGWAVRPMLTTVPKESLGETMEATLRALR